MKTGRDVCTGVKLKNAGRSIWELDGENTALDPVSKKSTPLHLRLSRPAALNEFTQVMTDEVSSRPREQLARRPVNVHVKRSIVRDEDTCLQVFKQLSEICVLWDEGQVTPEPFPVKQPIRVYLKSESVESYECRRMVLVPAGYRQI